jgi:hypothetical protein
MTWPFVGRSEQLDQIRRWLAEPRPGPLVIVGEPGSGRTAVIDKVVAQLDESRDLLLRVQPGNNILFSSLGHLSTPVEPPVAAHRAEFIHIAQVAAAIARTAAGKRLVIVADDANLTDPASMLVLRHLRRHADAAVLLTRTEPAQPADEADPLAWLRDEVGVETSRLAPLSADEVGVLLSTVMNGPVLSSTAAALHAATGGNPGLLHDLMVRQRLRERMINSNGAYRLGDSAEKSSTKLTCRGSAHLLTAAHQAWTALDLARTEDLCRLATWSGMTRDVSLIKATVSLLHGRADEAITALHPTARRGNDPHMVLVWSMCLALGLGRTEDGTELLFDTAVRNVAHRHRLLAYRAWLLAVSGRLTEATQELAGVDRHDHPHADLFSQVTRAIIALGETRTTEAISYLRRAIVLAKNTRHELPWLLSYLRAYLIDALLLAGHLSQATAMASGFHAAAQTGGWDVAVAMSVLTRTASPCLT